MATVSLVDGQTISVPAELVDDFRGLDQYGNWVAEAPFIGLFPLTPCCHASGTGSGEGVACRNCYAYVDSYFGGSAVVATARA